MENWKEYNNYKASVTPYYIGGPKAISSFIKENLSYPEAAIKAGIEGTVYVNYRVDRAGKVGGLQLLQGIHTACDAEALRLVSALCYEADVVPENEWSREMKIGIHFKLPKNERPQSKVHTIQVNYNTNNSQYKNVYKIEKVWGTGFECNFHLN